MIKFPKELKPSLKIDTQCSACLYSNKRPYKYIESVYKDSSFPGFKYLKCKNCESLILCNFSNKLSLAEIHSKYYGKFANSKFQYRNNIKRKSSDIVNEWMNYYKDKIKMSTKKNYLDLGGGNGECAEAFRKMKFNSYIYEPDKLCKLYIKKNFKKIKVIGTENNLKKINKKFDIITLNYSLEHHQYPHDIFNVFRKILKKNGMVFIHVPSANSLQVDYLKEYSWEVTPPFHKTLFSLKGLKKFLSINKFLIKKRYYDTITFGWTRGIALKNKVGKNYEKLRKNKTFRIIDLHIDLLLEKISKDLDKSSIISVAATLKK
tara:strand:- start:76 stop:1032 length:957 start_codon:yes stop_codon:yes gene_type:complete